MIFDKNQTEFPSQIQKAVWAIGKNIVPLDITLRNIEDNEMREGLTQVYRFSIDILSDMYQSPERYGLINNKNCIKRSGNVLFYHWVLHHLANTKPVIKDEVWLIKTVDFEKVYKKFSEYPNKIDLLANAGIVYEKNGDETKIKSSKYPLFLRYYFLCYEQSLKYKLNCGAYLIACDFRIFIKKFKLTIDDLMNLLSDKEKEFVSEIHKYALSKGVKPIPCQYYHRVTYRYKKNYILSIEILSFAYLFFTVELKNIAASNSYESFLQELEQHPNKEEMISYFINNINCCNACFGEKKPKQRCGQWNDVFGNRRLLCGRNISKKKKSDKNRFYTEYDIEMLKQMIDLRIKVIDMELKNNITNGT